MTDLTASTPTPGRKTAEPTVMTRRALVRNTALAGGGHRDGHAADRMR